MGGEKRIYMCFVCEREWGEREGEGRRGEVEREGEERGGERCVLVGGEG